MKIPATVCHRDLQGPPVSEIVERLKFQRSSTKPSPGAPARLVRIIFGRLQAHGPANYQFQADGSRSCCVKVVSIGESRRSGVLISSVLSSGRRSNGRSDRLLVCSAWGRIATRPGVFRREVTWHVKMFSDALFLRRGNQGLNANKHTNDAGAAVLVNGNFRSLQLQPSRTEASCRTALRQIC